MRARILLALAPLMMGGCSLIFSTSDITQNDPVSCDGPATCVALVTTDPTDQRRYCLAGDEICAPFCDLDADCGNHPDGNVCFDIEDGEDFCGCASSADCPLVARPNCDPRTSRCIGCRSDDDCPDSASCVTMTGICRPDDEPACDEDDDGFRDDREECREPGIVVFDCDDTNDAVFPGAPTVCQDGAINDCNAAFPVDLLEAAGIQEIGVASRQLLAELRTTAERIELASAARPGVNAAIRNVFTAFVDVDDTAAVEIVQWSVNPNAEAPATGRFNVPCAPRPNLFEDIQSISLASEAVGISNAPGLTIGVGAFFDASPEFGFALGRIETNVETAPEFRNCRLTGAEAVVQVSAGFDSDGDAYLIGATERLPSYGYTILSEGPLEAETEGDLAAPFSDAEGDLFVIATTEGLRASPLVVPSVGETVPGSVETTGRVEIIRRADGEGYVLLAPSGDQLFGWDTTCDPGDAIGCLGFEAANESTPIAPEGSYLSGAGLRDELFVVALRTDMTPDGDGVVLAIGQADPVTIEAQLPVLGSEDFDGEPIRVEDIRLAAFTRLAGGTPFATGYAVSVAVRRPAGAEIWGVGLQACETF